MIYWMSKATSDACELHDVTVYGFDTSHNIEPGVVTLYVFTCGGDVTRSVEIENWTAKTEREIDLAFRAGVRAMADAFKAAPDELEEWPHPEYAEDDFNTAGSKFRSLADDLDALTAEGK